MSVVPLRFRDTGDGMLLFSDDAGGYFRSDEAFLRRYVHGELDPVDHGFLERNGHSYSSEDDLAYLALQNRFASRLCLPKAVDYVILVPTLRCNLACGYCQVSRVNENTPGFDWSEETLQGVLRYLDGLNGPRIKIEFQGGEPLLRLDLLEAVRRFCVDRFQSCEFVVCTNLQAVSEEAWRFLSLPGVFVSTSIDGDAATHRRQRTTTIEATDTFFANLETARARLGNDRISALPTIDPRDPPSPFSIIDTFTRYGVHSIYLRPVNFQGFARKRYAARGSASAWLQYYSAFVDAMIEHNWYAEHPVEEYYLVHCLRRILRAGHDNHLDLRNPNILGDSYIVIDHDGRFYPTDEARMVTRVGQMDLSIGDIVTGIDQSKVDALNSESSNNFHPDCVHCVYQPYCGVDVVDDLSRYGRVDIPKHLTDFCQKHLGIFDLLFRLMYSTDPRVRKSLAIWAGARSFDPLLTKVHP